MEAIHKFPVGSERLVRIRISASRDKKELGHAYLYILSNDLHDRPFGFLEDVFVDESCRGEGIGSRLVRAVIEEAKARGCYKLIATSRFSRRHVHAFYRRLGFQRHGFEFRIDF